MMVDYMKGFMKNKKDDQNSPCLLFHLQTFEAAPQPPPFTL